MKRGVFFCIIAKMAARRYQTFDADLKDESAIDITY